MPDLQSSLIAALTGFVSGLLLSIPVGPINLTIINEGARRGFKWAVLIGLGAVLMEVIYCALAFTGFASFFSKGLVKAAMELFSFAFMLYLGLKFLLAKSIPLPSKLGHRVEEKLHPHSAFMTGFVRVLGNPGVFVFWIILAANFISREWVPSHWTGKVFCVGGVALGCAVWFLALSYAVSLRQKEFNEKTLLKMERVSGLFLLVVAFLHGLNIMWQMTRQRPNHSPPAKPQISWIAPALTATLPSAPSRWFSDQMTTSATKSSLSVTSVASCNNLRMLKFRPPPVSGAA